MKYFLILLLSCSAPTINLTKHTFNDLPQEIIWFQVAGLSEEHLALVHFEQGGNTLLEDSTCFGKSWHYNLYDIRPSSMASSMAQILGTKDITNNCFDFKNTPFWSFFNNNFRVKVLESSDKNTLAESLNCYEDFLKKITLVRISKKKLNHSNILYEDPKSDLAETIIKNRDQNSFDIYLIRDFTYEDALKKGKIDQAKNILQQILTAYNQFRKSLKKSIIIVSGVNAIYLNLPNKGRWKNIKPVFRSALLSPVWAHGSNAENFCGIYNDAEITSRLLFQSE